MFGLDAAHTHANPAEHILIPSTVPHLVADWSSFPMGGSLFSSPVIADGIVYINSLDGHLYAYKVAGCGQSSCGPLWFSTATGSLIYSTPAVANGIVYVSSYDRKLYAFNAPGVAALPVHPSGPRRRCKASRSLLQPSVIAPSSLAQAAAFCMLSMRPAVVSQPASHSGPRHLCKLPATKITVCHYHSPS